MQNRKIEVDQNLQEIEKHGDLSFPMKIYWNDFTTYIEENISWHWHEEIEFSVVTKGVVEISAGTNTIFLEKGNAVFINANTLHQMRPAGDGKAYIFSIVANPCILGIEKGFALRTKYVNPFITNDYLKYQVISKEIDWQKRVIEKLQEMYTIFMGKEYGYEYLLHNLFCEIWFSLIQKIWRFHTEKVSYHDLDENRIYQLLEYIHKHYFEQITLEDMCRTINVSKSECCRCFKRNLRMSPFEYLILHRITMAAKKLEQTSESITEISASVGFNSNSYFCKLFHNNMNCTPTEYRKSRKKENRRQPDGN